MKVFDRLMSMIMSLSMVIVLFSGCSNNNSPPIPPRDAPKEVFNKVSISQTVDGGWVPLEDTAQLVKGATIRVEPGGELQFNTFLNNIGVRYVKLMEGTEAVIYSRGERDGIQKFQILLKKGKAFFDIGTPLTENERFEAIVIQNKVSYLIPVTGTAFTVDIENPTSFSAIFFDGSTQMFKYDGAMESVDPEPIGYISAGHQGVITEKGFKEHAIPEEYFEQLNVFEKDYLRFDNEDEFTYIRDELEAKSQQPTEKKSYKNVKADIMIETVADDANRLAQESMEDARRLTDENVELSERIKELEERESENLDTYQQLESSVSNYEQRLTQREGELENAKSQLENYEAQVLNPALTVAEQTELAQKIAEKEALILRMEEDVARIANELDQSKAKINALDEEQLQNRAEIVSLKGERDTLEKNLNQAIDNLDSAQLRYANEQKKLIDDANSTIATLEASIAQAIQDGEVKTRALGEELYIEKARSLELEAERDKANAERDASLLKLESEVAKAEGIVREELEGKLAIAYKDRETALAEISAKEVIILALNSDLNSAKAEIELISSERTAAAADKDQEISLLKETITGLNTTVEDLNNQLAEALTAAGAENSALTEFVKSLQEKISSIEIELSNAIEEREVKVSELQRIIDTRDIVISNLNKELERMSADGYGANSVIADLQEKILKLEDQLLLAGTDSSKQVAALLDEISNMQQTITELENQVAQLSNSHGNSGLTHLVETLQSEVSDLKRNLSIVNAENTTLKEENKVLRGQIESLKQEIESMRDGLVGTGENFARIQELEAQVKDLTEQLAKAQSDGSKSLLEAEIKRLQSELEEANERALRASELELKIDEMEKTIDDLNDSLASIGSNSSRENELEEEIDALQSALNDADAEIKRLNDFINQLPPGQRP